MDLVYIVGPDPHHDHVELRYSLRSMRKYLYRVGKVFIVGFLPEWVRDVVHIPMNNPYTHNAGRNIYEKMRAACLNRELSAHFWAAADDHFLLGMLQERGYPYFHLGTLEHTLAKLNKESKFKPYVQVTYDALVARGLPTKNFNTHVPMIFNKDIFLEIMDGFDWERPKSYAVKALYPNAMRFPGVQITDCKIHTAKTKTAIYRFLKDAWFFSTNEHSINEDMKAVLHELYPDPSPWEIPDPGLAGPIISLADLKEKLNGKKNIV